MALDHLSVAPSTAAKSWVDGGYEWRLPG